MGSRSHFHSKEAKKTKSTSQQSLLKTRPFAIQAQAETDQQEHPATQQTQMSNDQKVGHHLSNYALTSTSGTRDITFLPFIQPKLTIGAPNDKYEQEADRVAQQVVQRLSMNPVGRSHSGESVQRDSQTNEEKLQKKPLADQIQRVDMSEEDEVQTKPIVQRVLYGPEPATEDLEGAIAQSRGRGQSLADTIRRPMEQAFGADFSGVRVHADTQSDQLNRSIQARAFTTGQDVFFRQGAYQPGSRGGQELIAHELTHVVQQSGRQERTPEPDGPQNINRMDDGQNRFQSPVQSTSLKLSSTRLSHDQPIQRLSLNNTQWKDATKFKGSEGGVGGVIFISDDQSTLVVKPDVLKDEEMIASHLHGKMAQKDVGTWNIVGLGRRFATVADIMAIKHQASKVGLENLDERTQKLLSQLRPDTTMIQEAADGVRGYGELLQEQTKQGGHLITGEERTVSKKSKIKKESPLKPLTKNPSFAVSLGRLAAADIFLGNFDRIMGSSNLDNLLMNMSQGKMYPIDNVHNASPVRFTQNAIPITLRAWMNHGLVNMFISNQYDELANEAWNLKAVTDNTQQSFLNDILEGFEIGSKPRAYNVTDNEKQAVITKLEKHLKTIKANFAKGLALGKKEIKSAGKLPKNNSWSDASADLYNDRFDQL